MHHRSLLSLRCAVILCGAPLAAAYAQTGFVSLHLVGGSGFPDASLSRTWIQGPSGLQEIFTQEFTPGSHTLALVEGVNGPCRATATNVTFTIVANKWTSVDVPITWRDCAFSVDVYMGGGRASGTGEAIVTTATSSGGAPTNASCHNMLTNTNTLTWVNFHACHGTIAYGATAVLNGIPDAGSSYFSEPDSEVVTFSQIQYLPKGASFVDTARTLPDYHFNGDLSIALVSSSYGGQVMSSTFRVVNHGPNTAYNIGVATLGDSLEDAPDVQTAWSASDGNCYTYPVGGVWCYVSYLPAGDSTTFTLRYSGTPDEDPNAPPPTLTQFCVGARVYSNNQPYSDDPPPDNNQSNNTAPCILHSLPVTVALGGSTPANQVVQKGSTRVPMLEFALTPTSLATLDNVTIKAQGSGNEQVDVTAVRLYLDRNGNGLVDGTDSVLASGAFTANDGSVTLTLNPAFAITAPVNILVTYDFNTTLAERLGGGAALAVLPFLLVPAMRRRRRLAILALLMVSGITLASCGSSSTGPGSTNASTYQATLTGVTASGFAKTGLSLAGATITIDK